VSYLPDDPPLTPDQRRREIARMLARGVLRLRSMAQGEPASAGSDPSDDQIAPSQEGVDVCATTRPHGSAG